MTSQQYVNQKALFEDVAAQLKQLQQKIFAGKETSIKIDDICYEGAENTSEPEAYEKKWV